MNLEDTINTTFIEYFEFLEIPSISTEQKGIEESIDWLKKRFEKLGAEQIKIIDDFSVAPVIMAKFNGNSDKTILIYNHYDVQPIDDIDKWETEPFKATIINEKLFCRGSSDCKGEIIARLMLIDYFQNNGGLPCNIIFFIEGEEEIGSPNLQKYLDKYHLEMSADVCLWECGWKNEKEQIEISCGVKGILSFDLEVQTAKQTIHSAYAGIVENPGWQLVKCLSSLKNEHNKITIKGFYDDIIPLNNTLINAIQNLEFDEESFKNIYGITEELIGSEHQLILVNEPTFNISNIQVGDRLSSNSIPSIASAKIDCRFVPNQTPEKLLNLLKQHIKNNNFENIKIRNVHYESAYRSDITNSYIKKLVESTKKIYGVDQCRLIPNLSGGGPMSVFGELLDIPIVSIGCSYSGSNVHSDNENIRLNDLKQNINCLRDWMLKISK
ncbi:M20/M25/M40 family metallo-hydrolase [Vagococcus sp.]|uniref:M20/M25/M40 family metallo-hydrolase n=1 Tax=Vagococcus sp. TaxID=1933889 RepID=UPI002FCAB131